MRTMHSCFVPSVDFPRVQVRAGNFLTVDAALRVVHLMGPSCWLRHIPMVPASHSPNFGGPTPSCWLILELGIQYFLVSNSLSLMLLPSIKIRVRGYGRVFTWPLFSTISKMAGHDGRKMMVGLICAPRWVGMWPERGSKTTPSKRGSHVLGKTSTIVRLAQRINGR